MKQIKFTIRRISISIIWILLISLSSKGQSFDWLLPTPNFYWGLMGTDANGNRYLGGMYRNTATIAGVQIIGTPNVQMLVVKMNSAGQVVWTKTFGSVAGDQPHAMAVSPDGDCYIGGRFMNAAVFDTINLQASCSLGDGFIAKLNTSGMFEWVKDYPCSSAENHIKGIALDNAENIYACGINGTDSLFPPHTHTKLAYIAKLDHNGNDIWSRQYDFVDTNANGGCANCFAFDNIKTDNFGNVYATGNVSFIAPYFGVIETDTLFSHSSGFQNSFLTSFDTAGNYRFTKEYLTLFNSRDLDVGPDGKIYHSGSFHDSISTGSQIVHALDDYDGVVLIIDSNGATLDGITLASKYDDFVAGVAVDSSNNIYMYGDYDDTAYFNSQILLPFDSDSTIHDIFLLKYNQGAGALDWIYRFGGNGYESSSNLFLSPLNEVYISGTLGADTCHFGAQSVIASESLEGFWARLGLPVSVNELITVDNSFVLFPNPAYQSLNVFVNERSKFTIINLLGEVVMQGEISNGKVYTQLDISFLSQGMYLVKIGNTVKSFVKE